MRSKNFSTVTELTSKIKDLLENNFFNVFVKGEISNFIHHGSGHMYFTLKDRNSEIKSVMFRGSNQDLNFQPANGVEVFLQGKISLYEARGQYQIIVSEMKPEGIGDLFQEFEKLKKKLQREGLFDVKNKKQIPKYPKKIALITSSTGAALQDMLNIFNRRSKHIDLILRPSLVQGERASADLKDAVNELGNNRDVDVIVIARGGGSIEDLWPFNSEGLAKEIFNCKVPIISGVGHETDFTICDMVADLRAPTPSSAAEVSVKSTLDILNEIKQIELKILHNIQNIINKYWQTFDSLNVKYEKLNPMNKIITKIEKNQFLRKSLSTHVTNRLNEIKLEFDIFHKNLYSLNPKSILLRGYSIAYESSGKIIKKSDQIDVGDQFLLKTGNGDLKAVKQSN
tara:strand:+ start:3765 stop:4958 length:1194 start_codon:yes stop_codon:yes gene_type:complete